MENPHGLLNGMAFPLGMPHYWIISINFSTI